MMGTPLEFMIKVIPSDSILPSFGLDIVWISDSAELSIFHINIFPMLDKFGLFLVVFIVEKDEFFRIKTNVFPKSKPVLVLESFIV